MILIEGLRVVIAYSFSPDHFFKMCIDAKLCCGRIEDSPKSILVAFLGGGVLVNQREQSFIVSTLKGNDGILVLEANFLLWASPLDSSLVAFD